MEIFHNILPKQIPKQTFIQQQSFPLFLLEKKDNKNIENSNNYFTKYNFYMSCRDFYLYLNEKYFFKLKDIEYEEVYFDYKNLYFTSNIWFKIVTAINSNNNNNNNNNKNNNNSAIIIKHINNYRKDNHFENELNLELKYKITNTEIIQNFCSKKDFNLYKLKIKRRIFKYLYNNTTYLIYDQIHFDNTNVYSLFTIYGEMSIENFINFTTNRQSFIDKQLNEIILQKTKPCNCKITQFLLINKNNKLNSFFPLQQKQEQKQKEEQLEQQHEEQEEQNEYIDLFEREEKAQHLVEMLRNNNNVLCEKDRYSEKQIQSLHSFALTAGCTIQECDKEEDDF